MNLVRSWGVLLLCACSSPVELVVPSGDHAATILVVDRGLTTPLEVQALAGDGAGFTVEAARDDTLELVLLRYPVTLPELGLMPGEIQEAAAGEEGVPLPAQTLIEINNLTDSGETGWQPVEERPPRVEGFRMRSADQQFCVEGGGCFEGAACVSPCPAPPGVLSPDPATLPEPPAPVDQRPCPGGWSERVEGTATLCGAPAIVGCDPGTQLLPGGGCQPLGRSCDPLSDFSTGLPAGVTVHYVAVGGTGDGSLAQPFGSIEEAALVAGPTDVIALGKGRFDGGVDLAGVEIYGACPEQSIIVATASGAPAIRALGDVALFDVSLEGGLLTTGGESRVEGVEIRDGGTGWEIVGPAVGVGMRVLLLGHADGGVRVHSGGRLTLGSARLEAIDHVGVEVRDPGSTAEVSDTIVVDVRGDMTDDRYGRGLYVQEEAELTLRRVLVESARTYGASAVGGELNAEYLHARSILPRHDDFSGQGLHVARDGIARVDRLLVDGASTQGAYVTGATVALSASAILNVLARPRDGLNGEGVAAVNGSSVTVEGIYIFQVTSRGLWIQHEDSTGLLADVTVDTVAANAEGERGQGLDFRRKAEVVLDRAHVQRALSYGVLVTMEARGTLADITVLDTEVTPADQRRGTGIRVSIDGVLALRRAYVARSRTAGVSFLDAPGPHSLEDVTVEDTHWNGTPIDDFAGLWTNSGRLNLSRVRVDGTSGIAVHVLGGGQLQAEDLSISGGNLSGLRIRGNVNAAVERVAIEGVTGENLKVDDFVQATLTDVALMNATSTNEGVGVGMLVSGSSQVILGRFVMGDNAAFGVWLDESAQLDARAGEVFGSQTGAIVADGTYDITRLLQAVRFRDNGQQLSWGDR